MKSKNNFIKVNKYDYKIEKYSWNIIICLTIITFLIRIYKLDYYSLWVDEYTHSLNARNFLKGTGNISNWEFNQIIVSFLNTISVYFFGFSDYVLKLPLVIISVFSIPLIYLFGKKLFNPIVGLISATLLSFSLFEIYWSRINRSYGIVGGFYLFLLLMFFNFFENKTKNYNKYKFFNYYDLNSKYFFWVLIALFLSICTQITTFLFFFSISFYSIIIFINKIKLNYKNKSNYIDKYAILSYFGILGFILFLSPLAKYTTYNLVSYFVVDFVANAVSPNWDLILTTLYSKDWNKVLNVYIDAIKHDFNSFYIIGFIGFIISFLINKKSALFIFSIFFVPLILMSFILRGLTWERYMLFFYPAFLIAGSCFIYYIFLILIPKFQIIKNKIKTYNIIALILILSCLIYFINFKKIENFITAENQGYVTDKEISPLIFNVPWNKTCEYINQFKKNDDIFLTSHVANIIHYLNVDSVYLCRQKYVKFQSNNILDIDTSHKIYNYNNASNYENFLNTYKKNKSGWVILDNIFFQSAYIDNRVKKLCVDSMFYHYGITNDGLLKVFSWDHSKIKDYKNNYVINVGMISNDLEYNDNFNFNIPESIIKSNYKIYAILECEGINLNDNAFLVINNDNALELNPSKATNILYSNNKKIQKFELEINKQYLKPKTTFTFSQQSEEFDGFAVYNLTIIMK